MILRYIKINIQLCSNNCWRWGCALLIRRLTYIGTSRSLLQYLTIWNWILSITITVIQLKILCQIKGIKIFLCVNRGWNINLGIWRRKNLEIKLVRIVIKSLFPSSFKSIWMALKLYKLIRNNHRSINF